MFRLKHISRAAMALCAGGFAVGAVAQQQLERVEITGSHIKRIESATVAPVEIVTREQIERTGQATIADVLRNMPANNGGSFGESFSNSFAPGAAGISLRGLGEKTTLVLLNGRRVTGYGFAQNLQDSFVDLNQIPSSAVERVEILKDGASAIYGSDAIAGVINIILRRDYKGVEITGGLGSSEGKGEYTTTLTGGFGDLATDKFNVFGVLDFYKRDELLFSDTKFGKDRDFRDKQGGRNHQSLTGGGTWAPLSPTPANPNRASPTVRQAISGCKTVLNADQAVAAGLLVRGAALDTPTNTFCAFDANSQLSALPGTERVGLLTRGTLEMSPSATAYAEVGLSHNKTNQTFTSPFFAGTTGLQSTPAGLRPYTYNIIFDPGVAGNPFAGKALFLGSLIDIGTRNAEITSDSLRGLVGAKYTLASWDLDSAGGYSKNIVTQQNSNRLSLAGTSAAFNVPTTPPVGTPPVFPTSTSSSYNLDNPASNSQAARDQLLINFPRKSTSELTFIDTKASTEFASLKLPGGAVGLALGIEYRSEKLNDQPDPNAQNGNVLGQGITATTGKRTSTALYSELALPITKQIEAQLAARYDRYSDYGTSTTPKVGLKYTPNDMLALRANWGKGFRAPTLPEISPSVATFFTSVIDPEDGVTRQISGVFAGNPNLKAERSTSTTVGIVFAPNPVFSMSIDAYKIDWRDVVASPNFQDILDASCPNPPTSDGGAPCPTTARVLRDPGTNQVVTILSNYENLSQRKTSGVDIDTRLAFPAGALGKFTTHLTLTYIHSFKEDGVEVVGSNVGTNTIPRIKAALAQDWDQGPWSFTARANYTHSYYQELLPASFRVRGNPLVQHGVYPDRVRPHTTFDVFGRYKLNEKITLSGSIINIFNETPPYDPGFSTTTNYDFSQYDVRGRQFRVTFNYKI